MKKLTLFLALLISKNSFAFWEEAMSLSEKAANVEILTDSVMELSDSISDESELNNHLNEVKKGSSDIRNTLRDMDYTDSEINDILQGSTNSTTDLASSISRTARRITRAKNLVKRLGLVTSAKPEAVTAAQTVEMNQTLRDIHIELQHQRMDRELEKEKYRADLLQHKLVEKKKEAFFKRQFALMEDSSQTSSESFFPFKTNNNTSSALSKHAPINF